MAVTRRTITYTNSTHSNKQNKYFPLYTYTVRLKKKDLSEHYGEPDNGFLHAVDMTATTLPMKTWSLRKAWCLENLPGQLKPFSLFLGKFSCFAEEKFTFVDLLIYDVLDQNLMFERRWLDEFPNLKAFMCFCETLEKIVVYMQSECFFKMTVIKKMAQWGNKSICWAEGRCDCLFCSVLSSGGMSSNFSFLLNK